MKAFAWTGGLFLGAAVLSYTQLERILVALLDPYRPVDLDGIAALLQAEGTEGESEAPQTARGADGLGEMGSQAARPASV